MKRWVVGISFAIAACALLFVWLGDEALVYQLTREDGMAEGLTAVFYGIGLLGSLVAAVRCDRKFLPIIWAALCLLFLGEETSWFQRQLNYSVPGIEEVNAQGEFNLHNLNVFHGGSLLDQSGGLATLCKSQNLFRMGFFFYFLVVPLGTFIPFAGSLLDRIGYQKPDGLFLAVMMLLLAGSFGLVFVLPETSRNPLAEVREMLYALFIMTYVVAYIWFGWKKASDGT